MPILVFFAGEELTQLEQKTSTISNPTNQAAPSGGLQCYGRQFLIVR